ncbi:MAG: hypothetical protein AAF184_22820 [Pseudomonadota bacterium]
MIFAELRYVGHYDDRHDQLVALLTKEFADIQSGHQGDSWIWVCADEQKVSIDTFSAMTHQIKAEQASALVARVIEVLSQEFKVEVFAQPELESHEEARIEPASPYGSDR